MKEKTNVVNHYIGLALKNARESRKLGIRDVSSLAPCAVAHLYDIERRKSDLTIGMANRLCKAIGITLSTLVREAARLKAQSENPDAMNL